MIRPQHKRVSSGLLLLCALTALGCGRGKVTDTTDSGEPAPTTDDCSDEEAPEVDWLAEGDLAVGWQTHAATSTYQDTQLNRLFVVYYPAQDEGEGATPDPTEGPFSVVFFEHAGGAHYLDYETIFSRLASHGIVVVSIDHTEIDNGDIGWGSTDFWATHDLLFQDTIDEMMDWNASESNQYADLIDPDQMGLAGHSHGAALQSMQSLGPMSLLADHTIRAVGLLAPCPDAEMVDYLDTYADMPPLQVIYGSRDQDGCVAYGQSIAILEAAQNPRHFVHLVGGSHYGFTDSGDLSDASISREDHQVVGLAGWLAWWKYTLEDDKTALPYLRGDRPLVESGPEIRTQFLDADPLEIDNFNYDNTSTTEWVEVPAIVGIEGQTYINGFLSDAFVDSAAGSALVQAEITSLIDTADTGDDPADVLFFVDTVLGVDAYGAALDALEATGDVAAVRTTNQGEFVSLLEGADWDLVIWATQDGSQIDENASDGPMADWICDGGRAIVSDYRMDSNGAASVLACSLTGFDNNTNYESITSDGDLFDGSLDLFNPGWGYYALGLETTEATVFAHAMVETTSAGGLADNAFGHAVEESGLSVIESVWMLDSDNGLYHPNWGLAFSWEASGAILREVLSDDAGIDITDTPVVSFRILQLDGDLLNPADTEQDLHVVLTDSAGTSASVLLSAAPQGALRPGAEVGAGTPEKSVYETYRLPLALFTADAPSLDPTAIVSVEWVMDVTETGALVMDDITFSRAGLCE